MGTLWIEIDLKNEIFVVICEGVEVRIRVLTKGVLVG